MKNNQITPTNEVIDALIHDFTVINSSINSSTNASIKPLQKKCKVLNEEQITSIFRRLNMVKVRNKRFKQQDLLPRRTKREIRDVFNSELKKSPSSSIYQIHKNTKLAYQTIRRILDKDAKEKLPKYLTAKHSNATYVRFSDAYLGEYNNEG